MANNFPSKTYFAFMLVLPLVFCTGIADTVLLPRQLLLCGFVLVFSVVLWGSVKFKQEFGLHASQIGMLTFLGVAGIVTMACASVLQEGIYVWSKLAAVTSFWIVVLMACQQRFLSAAQLINGGIIFGCMALATALTDFTAKTLRGAHLLHWVYTVSGNFANKNLLSSILFLCIPFWCIGMRRAGKARIISAVALLLAIMVIMVLRTRVVIVALGIYALLVVMYYGYTRGGSNPRSLRRGVLMLIVVLGLIAAAAQGFGQLSSEIDKYSNRLISTRTLDERLLFWQNSWEMFREYPWGVGLGNWPIFFPNYGLDHFQSFEIANGLHTLQRPHNDFLWILCETGILGLLAFLSVFLLIIHQVIHHIAHAKASERWNFVYVAAGITGFVVISFFDFPIERIEHMVLLMVLFAYVSCGEGMEKPRWMLVVPKRILLFTGAVALFGFIVAWSRLDSEQKMHQLYAARASGDSNEAIALSQDAESMFYILDSNTIPVAWYQGVGAFAGQDFAQSERCFERAYAITPYNIHVINNLASNYEVNGKRVQAIEMYTQALKISRRFEEARLNLAAVYFNDKQYERAFRTIDLCPVTSKDPKYKIFLPPILKVKASIVLQANPSAGNPESRKALILLQDFTAIYTDSKKNNVTFDYQIIKHLNSN